MDNEQLASLVNASAKELLGLSPRNLALCQGFQVRTEQVLADNSSAPAHLRVWLRLMIVEALLRLEDQIDNATLHGLFTHLAAASEEAASSGSPDLIRIVRGTGATVLVQYRERLDEEGVAKAIAALEHALTHPDPDEVPGAFAYIAALVLSSNRGPETERDADLGDRAADAAT